jgi:hypothetical protein
MEHLRRQAGWQVVWLVHCSAQQRLHVRQHTCKGASPALLTMLDLGDRCCCWLQPADACPCSSCCAGCCAGCSCCLVTDGGVLGLEPV